jgi:hypothetical protein
MKVGTKIVHKHSYTLHVKYILYVSCDKHGSETELSLHIPNLTHIERTQVSSSQNEIVPQ